jgi:2-keto-myo-inositol isomerase
MLNQTFNRRKALQIIGVGAGVFAIEKAQGNPIKVAEPENRAFTFCLNMATIRGHKLGFIRELETASAAGFRSVEIWIDSLQAYLNDGGKVSEAKKQLDDLGLKIENSISFNEWIVDDKAARNKGMEQMKREMEILAALGCKRIAATGKGADNSSVPALNVIADRYRAILDLGDRTGVIPQIEMWGFQKNLSNVGEVLYIAMESGHSSARVLLDIFHLYKGNTSLDTLSLMDSSAVEILHMNDYPATLSSEVITDADRVYPGDGAAPLKRILQILSRNGQPLVLSTELFNKAYYNQDALLVAKTSLSKMKAVVSQL